MYATERSVFTLSTPIASNWRYAIVPVASWVSVWSILRPISVPFTISPSTICALMIFSVSVSPISLLLCVSFTGAAPRLRFYTSIIYYFSHYVKKFTNIYFPQKKNLPHFQRQGSLLKNHVLGRISDFTVGEGLAPPVF